MARVLLAVPLVLLSLVASPSEAEIVQLSASKDNTLYQDPEGNVSNGAGWYFFSGRTDDSALRRGVIAFNVAAAVPPNSTILSATLTLYMSRTSAGPKVIGLHRLTANWGESGSNAEAQEGAGAPASVGDATWLHTFYPGSLWAMLGGDYSRTVSAATIVAEEDLFYSWNSAQLTADVQNMLDNPAGNFGWILIGDESEDQTTKRFNSRSNPNPTRRPVLEIEFMGPIPAASTWGLTAMAVLLLGLGSGLVVRRFARP